VNTKALSIEKSILEGELEIKDFFQFVLENAEDNIIARMKWKKLFFQEIN